MGVIGIAIAVIIVLIIGYATFRGRYRVADPDEALVINGRKKGGKSVPNPEAGGKATNELVGQKVVIGSGVFVKPLVERAHSISLASRNISLEVSSVVTANNIAVDVKGVAIVKVGGTEQHIRAAAQRFLGQQDQIKEFAQDVLNGALRSIIGGMTVQEINQDRQRLAEEVRQAVLTSMDNQGLVIDTLQIQQVSDEGDYIRNLSRPEASRIEQEALVAESEARRIAAEKEAEAESKISDSQKSLDIRRAANKSETDVANAEAERAGQMAQAEQEEQVIAAQEKVAIRNAELIERQLDAEVRKPADAERYKREQEAESDRVAAEKRAQAEAIQITTRADADLKRRNAEAEAISVEGRAEAEAIAAKGRAEAEAKEKMAEAMRLYGEAATLQMIMDVLPDIYREVASPMSNIDNLTVVGTEGASAVTKTVGNTSAQVHEMLKSTVGIDLVDMMKSFSGTSETEVVPVSPSVDHNDSTDHDQSAV